MVSWTPVRTLKLLAAAMQGGGAALAALWTFPSMLLSAFLVAWGAEAAQFLISQGLALAILAWVQTLPEFAVEAVIAWEAGGFQRRRISALGNSPGGFRLFPGPGWRWIFFSFPGSPPRPGAPGPARFSFHREPAIEA